MCLCIISKDEKGVVVNKDILESVRPEHDIKSKE